MVIANTAHARVPKTYQYPGQPDYITRSKSKGRPQNLQTLRRVLAGFLVLGLALVVVFRYGQISQINMEINRDTRILNALIDEQRHLNIKVAELMSMERLEQVALGELGLHYPHSEQFRYVGKNYPESGDGDGE